MTNSILKYSNGWGHLIMSLATLGVGVYLIVAGYSTIGVSLIATVSAAWFIPGAAKQVASSVQDTVTPMATQAAAGNTPTTTYIVPPAAAATRPPVAG